MIDLNRPLRIRTCNGRVIPVLRVISEDGPNTAPIVVVAKGDSGSGGELYAKMPANNGANETMTTEQVTEKVIHETVRRLAMQMAQQTGVLLTTIDLDWRIAYRVGDESVVDLGEVRVTTKSAQ